MGKINYSFEIHHLSVWVFPRASARLANSLVSFFRVAVYLVLISNMLTDGKAHQRQHNRDEEYSLDKRRHDSTWNWARSICRHANNWMTPCDPPITEGKAIFKRRQYFPGDAREQKRRNGSVLFISVTKYFTSKKVYTTWKHSLQLHLQSIHTLSISQYKKASLWLGRYEETRKSPKKKVSGTLAWPDFWFTGPLFRRDSKNVFYCTAYGRRSILSKITRGFNP